MNKGKELVVAIATVLLTLTGLAQAQNPPSVSPEDLVLRLERERQPGGSRGAQACAVIPKSLTPQAASKQVWSLQPLLVWQLQGTQVDAVQLSAWGELEPLWRREPSPGTTQVLYDGPPLEPGRTYEWELVVADPLGTGALGDWVEFTVMPADERAQVARDLAQLEARVAATASEEAIALRRATYFAERALWSDALRELYSVAEPSPTLAAARAQLGALNFCNF